MKIKLGYACINETLKAKKISFKTMTVKHFNQEELIKRTRHNFDVLYKILKWNIEHDIKLYRVSSALCPLATHEINTYKFYEDNYILNICNDIRKLVKDNNIMLSMHPDQFCVLNSPNTEVVNNSIINLEYHNKLADLISCNCILIHIGGVYGNKVDAINRFIDNYNNLVPNYIKEKLYFENDDKSYNVAEVLNICEQIKRPMILDYHHDRCLKSQYDLSYCIDNILNTWSYSNLEPKCHLSSSSDDNQVVRSHADYVTSEDLINCINITKNRFNIMLECKKKELSLLELKNNLNIQQGVNHETI